MAEAHTVWSSPHFALWNHPRALHQALRGHSKHRACPYSKATLCPIHWTQWMCPATSTGSYPCFATVLFFPASSSKYPLCTEGASQPVSLAHSWLLRTGGVCELPGRRWRGDPSIPGHWDLPFTNWIIDPSRRSRETLVCASANHSSAVSVWKKKCFQSLHSQATCISDKQTHEKYLILLHLNCCKAPRRLPLPIWAPSLWYLRLLRLSHLLHPTPLLSLPGANAGSGGSETTTVSCRDRDCPVALQSQQWALLQNCCYQVSMILAPGFGSTLVALGSPRQASALQQLTNIIFWRRAMLLASVPTHLFCNMCHD